MLLMPPLDKVPPSRPPGNLQQRIKWTVMIAVLSKNPPMCRIGQTLQPGTIFTEIA
jgi:hypothetical protein